jgi:hypothetical protein
MVLYILNDCSFYKLGGSVKSPELFRRPQNKPDLILLRPQDVGAAIQQFGFLQDHHQNRMPQVHQAWVLVIKGDL